MLLIFFSFVGGNCRGNFRSHSDFSLISIALMKKMLLAAGSLLSLALAQTSCHAPAPPAPKSEPIAAGNHTHQVAARKSEPAKPTSQPSAPRQVVVRQAPLASLGFTRFIEKPHLRKVKYGKRQWVLV
jgi:hypothetical protein